MTAYHYVFKRNDRYVFKWWFALTPGLDGLSVDVMNLVDIAGQNNKELGMKVETGIFNKNKEFFTDLNGFQVWCVLVVGL